MRPSGADALLKNEEKYGYALADAHICRTTFNNPLQLDCAAVIQLDCCEKYMIEPPYKSVSNLIYNKKNIILNFGFYIYQEDLFHKLSRPKDILRFYCPALYEKK